MIVRSLQALLSVIGHAMNLLGHEVIKGDIGGAVKLFQEAERLPVTGGCDDVTFRRIWTVLLQTFPNSTIFQLLSEIGVDVRSIEDRPVVFPTQYDEGGETVASAVEKAVAGIRSPASVLKEAELELIEAASSGTKEFAGLALEVRSLDGQIGMVLQTARELQVNVNRCHDQADRGMKVIDEVINKNREAAENLEVLRKKMGKERIRTNIFVVMLAILLCFFATGR
jgi:hypothetical protein